MTKIIKNFNSYKKINEDSNNSNRYVINTSYEYEWVKTKTLWEYKDYDRSVDSEMTQSRNDTVENIDKLRTSISEEGFLEPLIVQYSHKYKTAYLIEGNHRMVAAMDLNIDYVPVRVTVDGVGKQDAKKVVGYYAPLNGEFDVYLPSDIGIPDCLDRYGKPVDSEVNVFEEFLEIDFDKLSDVVVLNKTNNSGDEEYQEISVKFDKVWDCIFLFNGDDGKHIQYLYQNYNTILSEYGTKVFDFLDRGDGVFFTEDMWNSINYIAQYPEDYKNVQEEYFYEHFQETPEFELYMGEIANVMWTKVKVHDFAILRGEMDTPFAGSVHFENLMINDYLDNEKDGYVFYFDSLIFRGDEIGEYEFSGDEKTFKEILKYNYDYNTNIDIDFIDVKNISVKLEELDNDKIFKKI